MANNIPSNFDPVTMAFLNTLKSSKEPQLYELTPAEARKVFSLIQDDDNTPKLDATIEDINIQISTGTLSIRIVKPPKISGPIPVVLYCHGGGWVLGNFKDYDRLTRQIANGSGAAVVMPDYSLAPEAPYPIALEQCYAALSYIVKNGSKHNLDSSRIAIAGDSAGANIAAALVLVAKQRQSPKITFQLLMCPVTNADFNTSSWREFAAGPWLSAPTMKWFWQNYVPDINMRKNPTASPLQASIEELQNLPETFIITAEHDILRDEGEAYAQKLIEAGVTVSAVRYIGTVHAFMMLNILQSTPTSQAAIAQSTIMLSRVFKRT